MYGGDEKTPLLQSGASDHGSLHLHLGNEQTNGISRAHTSGHQTSPQAVGPERSRNHTIKRLTSLEKPTPMALSWKDVNVSVRLPGKKRCCRTERGVESTKQVLQDVTGIVQPGTLLAIMGASGAGKSTLLNVLTRRNTKSYVFSGDIRLNGHTVGDDIKNVSAYVQQDDLFIGKLTVREHLQFRALLRMDKRLSRSSRLARVEEVIAEMGLSKCANSRIGDIGGGKKGISGGERKRLSFASEALTNPPIFFCDEPTSGLDTFMAQNIVLTLQAMADKGKTVLCTIHQPSSDLFSFFNRILLLSEGRTVFIGPPEAAMEFFERNGYPSPKNYNPADHFIFTLAFKQGQEEECREKTQALCQAFDASEEATNIREQTEKLNKAAEQGVDESVLREAHTGESRYHVSWLVQFRYLLWRSWISVTRDVMLFKVRIIQSVFLAVILGLIYLQLTIDQKGVMNINGALFLLITNQSFSNMISVVNSFPYELTIFLREYGTGLYRTDVYYLAKSLAELPVFGMVCILFTTVTYWMMGLYGSWDAYLIAVGVLLLTANTALSLGYLISTISGSVNVALAIAPALMIPFMLFGGLFLNSGNIPVYFIWLKYLSWFGYSNEVLMVNQWQNVHNITCDVSSLNSTAGQGDSKCLYKTGDDVLEYTSFDKDNVLLDVGVLLALIVGFRLLSLVALVVRAKRSKE